jgi:ATP-dependent RNA circularization protein (DNA/RNA ligase family)
MVAETIVPSNASFVTIYTGHPWGRRTILLGKMIASAWTRVVEELKEGHNLREPVPPRHSPVE